MAIDIVATLDTKGEEVAFARRVIESAGADAHLIDVGVMGEPTLEPDTDASAVAQAAGTRLEQLRAEADRGEAMASMGEGAAAIVHQRYEDGQLDGVLGLGGSGNTSIATTAMQALPVGVPKVMLSTVAAGDVSAYVGATDLTMMHSVADIEGINRLTRQVISNAALAVVGMVETEPAVSVDDAPTIALTMFGVTTPCVQTARTVLEEHGYETIVFHATGTGGRAMETLIRDGLVDGVLDVTTTEWADELVGGTLSAGPDRLDAAAETGIPQVVSVGALDMVNFGPRESVPDEFAGRTFHVHNPQVTLMRTTAEENAELGRIIGEKLANATGPTALFLPRGGISMIDVAGEPFFDPDADDALFDALRANVGEHVDVVEHETDINDETFATAMATHLLEYLEGTDAT